MTRTSRRGNRGQAASVGRRSGTWTRLRELVFSPTYGSAFRRGLIRSMATGLLVGLLSVWAFQTDRTDLFRSFELKTLDARFRLRGHQAVSSPLSIIFIGDDSIEAFGHWPWRWDYHALLIDILSRAGARMVLFDILFAERPGKGQAQFLADMSRRAGNTYFCAFFTGSPLFTLDDTSYLLEGTDLMEPIPELQQAAAGLGHCNARPDSDGTTRRVPLLVRYQDGLFPAAPLLMAADSMGVPVENLAVIDGNKIELKPPGEPAVHIPVDSEGQTMVNYSGNMEAFRSYSFRQVIEADQYPDQAALDLSALRDQIVLVGTTFAGNTDLRPSPFSSIFPMFLTQAALLDNILQRDFINYPPALVTFVLWILAGALIGGLTFVFKPLFSLSVSAIVGMSYLSTCLLAFTSWNWYLELVGPLFTILMVYIVVTSIKYFIEERRARSIRRMFSSYATERVVSAMISKPHLARLGGERRDVTVLFSDIRGFTAFSETHQAEEVVAMLNEYLGVMTDVVFRWEGTLDKFIGDAIVAFWGAPDPQDNHPELAVRCALDMIHRLEELQAKWTAEGKKPFHIGIGINSGEVIVGNIGAEGKKMDYTVIGDPVNLGARVEHQTKKYGCSILLTEYTLQRLRVTGRDEREEFRMKELGPVVVRGKKKPVTVFQLLTD